jgi:regulatory protein
MKYKDAPHKQGGIEIEDKYLKAKQIKKECLRLLTRRDHSQKEIQAKLANKGYDLKQVLTVIDELARESWQDDTRYAESYARVRSQKGIGPVRIGYELRQQGIDPVIIDKIITATTDNWMAILEQVYAKKYPESKSLDNNERAKRNRFLTQRGFSGAMISAFFNQFTNKST